MMNYLDSVYTEPHRYYHTITHIHHMLTTAHEHNIVLTESQWLAVLWHDSVYDVNSSTNEQDSVLLMKKMIPITFNYDVVDQASAMILDT
jgi:predicted metal-dependent HD superfamily phosphohydrolase